MIKELEEKLRDREAADKIVQQLKEVFGVEDEELSREILTLMANLKTSRDESSRLLDDQNLRNSRMSTDLQELNDRLSKTKSEVETLKKAIAEKGMQLDEAETRTAVSQ